MQVGYIRVSKADGSQVLDLQRDAVIEAGVEPANIYEDKCSGSKDERPGLAACLKALRKGDVLVIWRLDRLGRNLKHLIETVHELSNRGVGFKVLTGAPIDTTSSQGKLMFAIFAGSPNSSATLSANARMRGWQRHGLAAGSAGASQR